MFNTWLINICLRSRSTHWHIPYHACLCSPCNAEPRICLYTYIHTHTQHKHTHTDTDTDTHAISTYLHRRNPRIAEIFPNTMRETDFARHRQNWAQLWQAPFQKFLLFACECVSVHHFESPSLHFLHSQLVLSQICRVILYPEKFLWHLFMSLWPPIRPNVTWASSRSHLSIGSLPDRRNILAVISCANRLKRPCERRAVGRYAAQKRQELWCREFALLHPNRSGKSRLKCSRCKKANIVPSNTGNMFVSLTVRLPATPWTPAT